MTSRLSLVRQMAAALLEASDHPATPPRRVGHMSGAVPYAALKAEVKAQGLLEREHGYYAYKFAVTLAFYALPWVWIGFTADSAWVWLAPAMAAFASGQSALLGHDATHQAVFSTPRANAWLSLITINLLCGGSYGWWKQSHNDHHARSNDPEFDPDTAYPFFAFSAEQADLKDPRFRAVLGRQHVLAFLAMSLVGINLRAYSTSFLLRHPERRAEIAAMLLFWVIYPASLIGLLGPGKAFVFFLLHQALFGMYVGLITAMNHWGMPMPRHSHTLDFVTHQVSTSRNIAGGPLVDLIFGGLNRQIEHHLFPTMPRNNLVRARGIVQRFCAAHGIPYVERSPLHALRDVHDSLRAVACHVTAAGSLNR